MATSHEIWKDASDKRVIALDKAIELNCGKAVSHKHILDVAKDFAEFLLGNEKR